MRSFRKYLITVLVGLSIVGLIAFSKDIFAQTTAVRVYHILCDAFFAAGTFITCAGLLIFSSNEGTFDMLIYGTKAFFDMFRKTSQKKYDSFYDYRTNRAENKLPFGFLLICGLGFLAVSFVMYYLYCQYR